MEKNLRERGLPHEPSDATPPQTCTSIEEIGKSKKNDCVLKKYFFPPREPAYNVCDGHPNNPPPESPICCHWIQSKIGIRGTAFSILGHSLFGTQRKKANKHSCGWLGHSGEPAFRHDYSPQETGKNRKFETLPVTAESGVLMAGVIRVPFYYSRKHRGIPESSETSHPKAAAAAAVPGPFFMSAECPKRIRHATPWAIWRGPQQAKQATVRAPAAEKLAARVTPRAPWPWERGADSCRSWFLEDARTRNASRAANGSMWEVSRSSSAACNPTVWRVAHDLVRMHADPMLMFIYVGTLAA
ncbi:hypothetical protein GGX14DRAFT_384294 [Mycena pura]|uniref:Uncharacterized protein n=1 Tax=Mycena pura TaxID=153505 RepID=A0AAD6YV05_9AGAR|nr:hypothetical protein GGX14DRAFT_384294 [Mycena pura]